MSGPPARRLGGGCAWRTDVVDRGDGQTLIDIASRAANTSRPAWAPARVAAASLSLTKRESGRTWIAVPLVQAATAAPIAARLLLGGVRSVDRQPFEAAAVLGAGRLRRGLRIGVPLLGRPVAVAAGFAFAMAIGEFGATVFLARPDRPTIPILISRLLGRAGTGNFGAAMALSCVLAAIVIGAVALVDRRGRGQLG